MLQAYGHRVKAAYGGEDAVQLAARGGVQVALVDIGMPTVDGFQFARRIPQSPSGRETLLVAVTGWGETVGSELCTTVVEPANAPLDAAIATVAMAATTPAAKPTAAAKLADRMRRRLDD